MTSNVDLQRRFVNEAQAGKRLDVAKELIADDFVNHSSPPGLPPDKDGVLMFHQALHGAFPDLDVDIHDMTGDADKVWTYKTFKGTHNGEFLGIPATGKPVSIDVFDIVRYRDGQIVEHWNVVDMLGLMQQLGVIA